MWSAFRRTVGGEREKDSAIWPGATEVEPWPPLLFFFISVWKGWRPAERSWLWEDPGTIPLHAHANQPQRPRRRRGQTEGLQRSDLPVRSLRGKTGTMSGFWSPPLEVCQIITCAHVGCFHSYEIILLSSCEDEGCIHHDITSSSSQSERRGQRGVPQKTTLHFHF